MYVAPQLVYSDPSVLSLLPNDVVGPCVTTTLHKNGVLLVHMWDQLSDLKNKFRTKRRPEKLGNLSGKKLGEWTVINSLRYSCLVWYTK